MIGFRRSTRPSYGRRRGTTTVEFALVALPLFMFVFTSIELGRAMMNINTLEEGARAGCRAAILHGATVSEIESEIAAIVEVNGISANFSEMSWLPMPQYLANLQYTASATMPKEARTTLD